MSLIGLLKDKVVMVGAIDVASYEAETPEKVASTIIEATNYLPKEQIRPCTNCGMAPLPRDLALQKLQALGSGAKLAAKQ